MESPRSPTTVELTRCVGWSRTPPRVATAALDAPTGRADHLVLFQDRCSDPRVSGLVDDVLVLIAGPYQPPNGACRPPRRIGTVRLRPHACLSPSPSQSVIELGPLTIRAYGLMDRPRGRRCRRGVAAALGCVAVIRKTSQRSLRAVPAGLIGRGYHVLTDWRFDEGWAEPSDLGGRSGYSRWDRSGGTRRALGDHRNRWDRPGLLDAIARPPRSGDRSVGQRFNQERFGLT